MRTGYRWFLRERRMASTTVHTRKRVATRARMRIASRHCFTELWSDRTSLGPGVEELWGERVWLLFQDESVGKLPAAMVLPLGGSEGTGGAVVRPLMVAGVVGEAFAGTGYVGRAPVGVGSTEGAAVEVSSADRASMTVGSVDRTSVEVGSVVRASVTAGSVDVASVDVGSVGVASVDTGSVGVASVDTGSVDAASMPAGPMDRASAVADSVIVSSLRITVTGSLVRGSSVTEIPCVASFMLGFPVAAPPASRTVESLVAISRVTGSGVAVPAVSLCPNVPNEARSWGLEDMGSV